MLKDCTEESIIYIKELINNNSTHSFKNNFHYKNFNIIDLLCVNCGCLIQANYKTKHSGFALNLNDSFIKEYLTCSEVQIKRLLE